MDLPTSIFKLTFYQPPTGAREDNVACSLRFPELSGQRLPALTKALLEGLRVTRPSIP